MAYTQLGELSVVPAADLISATSNINKSAGTSVKTNDGPYQKFAGKRVMRAGTVGTFTTYSMVMASGPNPTDVWIDLSAIGTVYTPS